MKLITDLNSVDEVAFNYQLFFNLHDSFAFQLNR